MSGRFYANDVNDLDEDPDGARMRAAVEALLNQPTSGSSLGRRTGQFLADAGTSLPQAPEDYRTNQFLDTAAKRGVTPPEAPEPPTAPERPADAAGVVVRPHVQTRAEQIDAATGNPEALDRLLTPGFQKVGRDTGTVTSETIPGGPNPPDGGFPWRKAASLAVNLSTGGAPAILGALTEPRLPDAEMPDLPPTPPASVPELEPKPTRVEIGHAAHVDVPNTAVVRSALTAPIAPGEGRASPQKAPDAPAQDPVRRALTALALSAGPSPERADLDAALRAAAGQRFAAESAEAGGTMIGRGRDPSYARMIADSDRPVEEFQTRRALSEQERQHQALKAAAEAARGKEAFSEDMAKKKFGLEEAQLAETTRSHKAQEALKGRKLAGAGAGGGAAGLSKQAAKELAVLERSWDPSGPRSGERGKNQARVNAAGRIEALAMGPDGKVADLNPQQMTEMARQLDTLLSNGGQATEGITKALSAHTASGKVAELEQWLTSAPHGAGQRAFVQQMLETAHREKDVAGGQLRDSYIQTLPSVPTLLKERPDVIQNMLKAAGVDPEGVDLSTGLRRASSPAPAAHPPAPGMVRIRDPKTGRTGWAKPSAIPPGAEVVNAS